MKDLVISYNTSDNITVNKSYDTIMDFLDEIDSSNTDKPKMNYTNVSAKFFEKHDKSFLSIEALYAFCNSIVK